MTNIKEQIRDTGLGPFHIVGCAVYSGTTVVAACCAQTVARIVANSLNTALDGDALEAAHAAVVTAQDLQAAAEAEVEDLVADLDEAETQIATQKEQTEVHQIRLRKVIEAVEYTP